MSRFLTGILIVLSLAACTDLGEQDPAPITKYGQSSGAGSAGVHNVVAGDTLYTISTAYHMTMRDIVALNNLQAPFKLHEGQRLKLPPPQEYDVRDGDTIYDVSRLFGVNSSEIVRLNNLDAPYSLREGQMLRLPSLTRKAQIATHKTQNSKQIKNVKIETEVLAPPPGSKIAIVPLQSPSATITPTEKPQILSEAPQATPQAPQIRHIERVTAQTPRRSSSKFLRPVNGQIISDFGPKPTGLHNDGINIAAQKGTPILAAENGVVVYAGNELKGSGNLVLIRHEDQWVTAYAHMDHMDVRKGQIVKRGQSIGGVGATGSVSTPQLHFEIRRGTDAINPKNYMEN